MKIFLPIIFFFTFLFFSPAVVHAKLWINEFSSNGSNDWIEIYNQSDESVNLDGYLFRDSSATNKRVLNGNIEANGFTVVDWGDKLNNGGDTIKLLSASDENTIIDQVTYGNSDQVKPPDSGQSAGRKTDGASEWVLFTSSSIGESNVDSHIAPTVIPTPEKTPTPVKQPTPTKIPTPKKEPTPTKSPTSPPSKEVVNTAPVSVANATSPKTVSAKSFKISGVPTSILGMATTSASTKITPRVSPRKQKNVMVKSAASSPLLIMIAGTIFCLGCAILVFVKRRRARHEL